MSEQSELGREFEERFAALMDSEVQPQSGGGPVIKMDVRGRTVLWSCKATKHGSFSVNRYIFKEVERAAYGPGGTGDLPGVAVQCDGEVYMVMRAGDMTTLLAGDVTVSGDKASRKRRAARVPAALRGED